MRKIKIVSKTITGISHPNLPKLTFLDALCDYDDVGLLYQTVRYCYQDQEPCIVHQIKGKNVKVAWFHTHYKIYFMQYSLYYTTIGSGNRPKYYVNNFRYSFKHLTDVMKALLIKLIT